MCVKVCKSDKFHTYLFKLAREQFKHVKVTRFQTFLNISCIVFSIWVFFFTIYDMSDLQTWAEQPVQRYYWPENATLWLR